MQMQERAEGREWDGNETMRMKMREKCMLIFVTFDMRLGVGGNNNEKMRLMT